jgi:triacylglycerol lipase
MEAPSTDDGSVRSVPAGGVAMIPTPLALSLPSGIPLRPPPLWREGRLALELYELRRDPIYVTPRQAGSAQGVVLIPGYMSGDVHLGTMRRWLERCGHETEVTGMRANVDCSAEAVARIEGRLERLAERRGEGVVIIGQSRGGLFARALAVRRPELVSRIVTLGSPHLRPLAVHPLVLLQGGWLATVGSLGVPGIARHSCRSGKCCERFRSELQSPFPNEVGFTSVYSRSDGIVAWRACLDPAADCVEVSSSHCGMGVNVGTYRVLANELCAHQRRRESARPALRLAA